MSKFLLAGSIGLAAVLLVSVQAQTTTRNPSRLDSPRTYIQIPRNQLPYTVPDGKVLVITSMVSGDGGGVYATRSDLSLQWYYFTRKWDQFTQVPRVIIEPGQRLSPSGRTAPMSGYLIDPTAWVDGNLVTFVALDGLELPYVVPPDRTLVVTAFGGFHDRRHELHVNGSERGHIVTTDETVIAVGGEVVNPGSTVDVFIPDEPPYVFGGPGPILFGYLAHN